MPTSAQHATRPLSIALPVLLALAAWLPSLVRGGFAMDDRELVLENPAVDGSLTWTAAFGRDYFHHVGAAGQWRPLATLSFRAERALWSAFGLEQRPWPYHLGNVLGHALVVALAALLLVRTGQPGSGWPWLGLCVFAVHPALADSVAWISGRTSLVAAAGGLAGALAVAAAACRERRALVVLGSALGLLLALGGKEEGLVFGALYVALCLPRSRRLALTAAGGAALGLCAYLLLRAWALGELMPRAAHPVLAGASFGERLQLGGCALLEAFRLVLAPVGYPPQYRADFLLARLAPAPAWLAAGLGWTLFAALLAFGRPRAAAILSALALWPALHLVPIGEAFAPRFLYLPLLFAAPLVHAVWRRCPARGAVAALVLALLVVGAWQRSGVYAGRGAYRREVLRHQPHDAPSWNDLGVALEEEGELPGALAAWRRSIELRPAYSRPWSNLGRVMLAEGDLDEAERCFRRAVEVGPRNAVAHANLGSLLLRTARPAEAASVYERATELAPGLSGAWRGLGRARLETGDRAGAAQALRRALALDPDDEGARELLQRVEGRH